MVKTKLKLQNRHSISTFTRSLWLCVHKKREWAEKLPLCPSLKTGRLCSCVLIKVDGFINDLTPWYHIWWKSQTISRLDSDTQPPKKLWLNDLSIPIDLLWNKQPRVESPAKVNEWPYRREHFVVAFSSSFALQMVETIHNADMFFFNIYHTFLTWTGYISQVLLRAFSVGCN